MHSCSLFAHQSLPFDDNSPAYSETDSDSDNDRKLPAVAAEEPTQTPPKEKQTRTRHFTVAEMRSATKLLEQCEEYMTKSKDGRIPKRYDPLMCKIISINDRMDEAFGRKWLKEKEDEKEAAQKAEKDARAKLFLEARREVCDRYTAVLAGLKADSRVRAPNHALQKIIDQVTQEMNFPPDMQMTKDHIFAFFHSRNNPLKRKWQLGTPNKAGKK
jgi:hypothetical protein